MIPPRLVLAAAVFAMVTHAASLCVPFFWDDTQLVQENARLQRDWTTALTAPIFDAPATALNYYRPLPMTVFAATGSLFGWDSALPFQAVKLPFIGLLAAGIFAVFAAFFSPPGAFLLTCLFVLMPLNIEAAAWISGLPDVLAVAFGAWFVALLLPGLHRGRVPFAALGLLAAALLSKEGAAGLVPLALLLDAPAIRREGWRRLAVHAPLAAVFIAYVVLRSRIVPALPLLHWQFLIDVPRTYAAYAVKLVSITPLGMVLGMKTAAWDAQAVAGLLILAGLTAYAWFGRREPLRVAAAVFLAALLPYSNALFIAGESLIAERYMLWPVAALLLAAGTLFSRAPRKLSAAAALATAALYGILTCRQYAVWTDTFAHWEQITAVEPAKVVPRIQYADDLNRAGRLTEALAQLQAAEALMKAHSAAGRFYDTGTARSLFHGLAEVLLGLNRPDEALPHAREAFRIEPVPAVAALGVRIHLARKDAAAAYQAAQRAAARFPDDEELARLAAGLAAQRGAATPATSAVP